MLQELDRLGTAVELRRGQGVVVAAVDLTRSRGARARRDRELELGNALQYALDQRALPHSGVASDAEYLPHSADHDRRDGREKSLECRVTCAVAPRVPRAGARKAR